MSFLVALFGITSLISIPVYFILTIISFIKKKPAKKWLKSMGISVVIFFICIFIPTCEHEWAEATCLTPRTCTLCEKTQGSTVDHSWKEATCAKAKHCSVCNITEGSTLEHTWVEATCTKPKTCSVCMAKDGSALGHAYSEWEIDVKATISSSGTKKRTCSTCQESESKSYKLDSYIENGKFIFTPEEYRDVFFDNFVDLDYSKFGGAQTKTKDGQVIVAIIDLAYNNVGNIGFVADKNTWKMASSETQSGFDGIVMMVSANTEFVANTMMAVTMTCDPTVSEFDAREICRNLTKEGSTHKTTHNGIMYSFTISGNIYAMTAVPVA